MHLFGLLLAGLRVHPVARWCRISLQGCPILFARKAGASPFRGRPRCRRATARMSSNISAGSTRVRTSRRRSRRIVGMPASRSPSPLPFGWEAQPRVPAAGRRCRSVAKAVLIGRPTLTGQQICLWLQGARRGRRLVPHPHRDHRHRRHHRPRHLDLARAEAEAEAEASVVGCGAMVGGRRSPVFHTSVAR
jgi:hypothetical protein